MWKQKVENDSKDEYMKTGNQYFLTVTSLPKSAGAMISFHQDFMKLCRERKS